MRCAWFSVPVLSMVFMLSACEKSSPEGEAQESGGEATSGMVEVTAEGNEFDPPVSVDQIPEGAWYCDMGTVHYASMERGDGNCPICGMTLVYRAVDEPEPAEPAAVEPTEGAPTAPPATAPTPPVEPPTTQPM